VTRSAGGSLESSDQWPNCCRKVSDKAVSKNSRTRATTRIQYAALPFRATDKSEVEILLLTSRGTRRWVIPKGWPKSGMSPHDAAAEEAFEEAGVRGTVKRRSIGSYSYEKWFGNNDTVRCSVHVFAMKVTHQQKKWPEQRERKVAWCSPAKAAKIVQEPELRRLIRAFDKRWRAAR
jgi:8-oxo-dGTP pyrophosphatase MutT (NUDIX family)